MLPSFLAVLKEPHPLHLISAFPYDKGKPTCFLEKRKIIFIPHDIPLKFPPPEIQTGFRRVRISAPLMPMPEAAMDKDYCPVFCENNIWSPWKGFIRNSESVSHVMQHRADSNLGLCIRSSDAGHIPSAFFRGQRIHAKSSAAVTTQVSRNRIKKHRYSWLKESAADADNRGHGSTAQS